MPLALCTCAACAEGGLSAACTRAVGGTASYWVVHRFSTRLESPPRFRFLSFFSIVAPSPFFGTVAGLAPVCAALFCVKALIDGDKMLINMGYRDKADTSYWGLDSIYPWYSDVNVRTCAQRQRHCCGRSCRRGAAQVNPSQIAATRSGRLGACVLVLGLVCAAMGVSAFIPKPVSKKVSRR